MSLTKEQKDALIAEAEAKRLAKEKEKANGEKVDPPAPTEPKGEGEPEEPIDPPTDPKDPPKDVDYKAVAEEERKKREAAEKALADKEFKDRERRRRAQLPADPDPDENPDAPDDEVEKPLTEAHLEKRLNQERQATKKQLDEKRALEIARANTTSEDEAQAAYEIWINRVVPTGDLEADVQFAIGGLNSKRVVAQNEELRRTIRSKEARKKPEPNQVIPEQAADEPKLPPQDTEALKRSGFVWDSAKKLYKKPLAGSKKTLYFDPKSKTRWTA